VLTQIIGEVGNEYTAEKLVLFAIFVPKNFTIGRNLTKFGQKISLHSFFRHGVVYLWYLRIIIIIILLFI